MTPNTLSYEICKAATKLFLDKGYEQVTMVDIAKEAHLNEVDLYSNFGNKQDIILLLYQSINADWQQLVMNLPKGKLTERFHKALLIKLGLIAPYELFLGNIIGQLLQNKTIAFNAIRTSHIRAMGLKTVQLIIDGATDAKILHKKIKDLPAIFYMLQWGILFLQLQTNDRKKTVEALEILSKMIHKINNFSIVLNFVPFINELSNWASTMAKETSVPNQKINIEILKIIFNHRKISESDVACLENDCPKCFDLHDTDIDYFTSQQLPIHFILPAFPAKSPNTNKVLGTLPDLGEEIALKTLHNLCNEIKSIYEPGAHITICSDGRIFSTLVGVPDEEVSLYVNDIKKTIITQHLSNIDIVNLEDLMKGDSFDDLRKEILTTYAETIEELTTRLQTNAEFKKLFNGIHRFIVEDRRFLFPEFSTTKIKQESKEIALQLIQHSNAWTRFLTYVYPKAIRLSIHPYPSHSDKIGIKITKAIDNWMTPWHGVIVLQEEGYVLMKKSEAEEKKATLVFQNNKPHYYTLI
jgi:pyoverdine/dityrosine biosynthesis protein Dit1/AcrR family transcriptional regulator